MNRYLNEFLGLKCVPDVLAVVNPLGNKAAKEVTESMAVIRRLRRVSLNAPMEYGLIDLCAGNALTSVLATHLLPFKWALAIDKKPRTRKWGRAKRFAYHVDDINDEHVLDVLLPDLAPYALIAVHACAGLAERVIELYHQTEAARHLFLMPCCEGHTHKRQMPHVIRKQLGHYLAWCYHLQQLAGGNLVVDNAVLSPKNAIIIASKEDQ